MIVDGPEVESIWAAFQGNVGHHHHHHQAARTQHQDVESEARVLHSDVEIE